jgi:hypothetical protein
MYVFDTSSFIVLFTHFYWGRFPSLWQKFDSLISDGKIVSVREVYNEITSYYAKTRLVQWVKDHRELFAEPSIEELLFVREIFAVKHFQSMIRKKEILNGKPVADPFVIAKAKVGSGLIVTQEEFKENAATIPNVCSHFGVKPDPTDLEGFMEREGWTF